MSNPNSANPYAAPSASTPESGKPRRHLNVASQNRRFVNFIVDQIVVRIIIFGFAFVFGMFLGSIGSDALLDDPVALNMIFIPLGLLLFLLYFVGMEAATGATIGKLLTGTKVVNEQGQKPSFGQIIGRSFARLIPFEPFSFFFGDNTTGWHDSLSKTKVIRR